MSNAHWNQSAIVAIFRCVGDWTVNEQGLSVQNGQKINVFSNFFSLFNQIKNEVHHSSQSPIDFLYSGYFSFIETDAFPFQFLFCMHSPTIAKTWISFFVQRIVWVAQSYHGTGARNYSICVTEFYCVIHFWYFKFVQLFRFCWTCCVRMKNGWAIDFINGFFPEYSNFFNYFSCITSWKVRNLRLSISNAWTT